MDKRGFNETHFFIYFAVFIIVLFVVMLSFAVIQNNKEDKKIREFGGNVDKNIVQQVMSAFDKQDANKVIEENTFVSDDSEDCPDGKDTDGDGSLDCRDVDIDGDLLYNAQDPDVNGDGVLEKTPDSICVQEYGGEWMCSTNSACDRSDYGEIPTQEGKWCESNSEEKKICAKCDIPFVCDSPKCKMNTTCYDEGFVLGDLVCNNSVWGLVSSGKNPNEVCVQEYGEGWMCETNLICGEGNEEVSYEEGSWCNPRASDGKKQCAKCGIPFVCDAPKCKKNKDCYDNGYVLNDVVCNNTIWSSIPKVNLTAYFKFNLYTSDESVLSSSGTVTKPYSICAQANSLKSYLKFNIPFELSKIKGAYFNIWKNDARPMKLKLYKISDYGNLSAEDWNISKQFIADIPQILSAFSLNVSNYIDSQTVSFLIEANDYPSSQSCFYSSQVSNENARPKLQLLSNTELSLS